MRVLHLSLGLPPFRTGGLNRYCADLMQQQVEDGQDVLLLYPGEFSFFYAGQNRQAEGRPFFAIQNHQSPSTTAYKWHFCTGTVHETVRQGGLQIFS